MGAVEETGKVAGGVIEGLKSQPLALALIVLNIVFIIFVGWLAKTINARTEIQYKGKDEQITTLLQKLDTISEVRAEVAKNTALGSKINDNMERLAKGFDDHERRLRTLEQRNSK